MLYENPVPRGEVTFILPVLLPQIGCSGVATGAPGVWGAGFITATTGSDIQSPTFAVTL